MANPPVDVQKFGQSIWMDNIRRKLLDDGTFQKLINEDGVVGVTSPRYPQRRTASALRPPVRERSRRARHRHGRLGRHLRGPYQKRFFR
jgi:hypothetical protein